MPLKGNFIVWRHFWCHFMLSPFKILSLCLSVYKSHPFISGISRDKIMDDRLMKCLSQRERERGGGDIGLFITLVPKVLQSRFLICWLNDFGDLSKFWLVSSFSEFQTFQQLIVTTTGNFVYHHWECTSIFWLLSYYFIFLV